MFACAFSDERSGAFFLREPLFHLLYLRSHPLILFFSQFFPFQEGYGTIESLYHPFRPSRAPALAQLVRRNRFFPHTSSCLFFLDDANFDDGSTRILSGSLETLGPLLVPGGSL